MPRALRLAVLALLVASPLVASPAVAQDRTGSRTAPGLLPLEAAQDPAGLLRLSEAMLAGRRTAEAAELLERAESRLLTRSELASAAGRPASGGAVGDLAAARAALARRDVAEAQGLIASAIRRLEAGEAPPAPPPAAALPKTPPSPQLQSATPLPTAKPAPR